MASIGDEAKEILRDHYAELADNISAPIQLAQELFQKRVISQAGLGEVATSEWSIDKRNTALMRNARIAIGQNHKLLKVFAESLISREEATCSSIGRKILQKYRDKFGYEEPNDTGHAPADVALVIDRPRDRKRRLVIDDLTILMKLLKDINDWEILGLYLGIKKTSLDRIGKDKQDTKTRCCETIFYWLKHSRDDIAQEVTPTFSSLIAILKDLGHEETVESIECYLSSET